MKIVKEEKIYLSQNEANTWNNFYEILYGIERESANPNTISLINKVQNYLSELWIQVEEVE